MSRSNHPLIRKTFGQKLFSLRENACLTQRQVGDRIRVSQSLISKWELDEISPQQRYVAELAKMFGVSLAYWDDDANIRKP